MKWLDKPEVTHANIFFKGLSPNNLSILKLHSGLLSELSLYKDGLPNLLEAVKEQIFISKFLIDEETLKIIFENATGCQELVLYSCIVEKLSEKFTIEDSQECNLAYLDSFRTFHNLKNDELDEKSLRILVKALSRTQLKESIKSFHMLKGNFEAKDVHKIFKDNGLNIEIMCDWRAPLVLEE